MHLQTLPVNKFMLLLGLSVILSIGSCKPAPNLSIQSSLTALPANHPRILLTDSAVESIKRKIDSDSTFLAIHQFIIGSAKRSLKREVTNFQMNGRRLLEAANDFRKKVMVLAYAYRLTGEKAYAEKCMEEMMAVSNLPSWNPEHFLDVAEITTGMSIAMDWIYPVLTDEDRIRFASAIIEKGIKPSFNPAYNDFLEKDNNWNQVCNAGLVLGALATYESDPELSKQVLLRSIESNKKALLNYAPEGVYDEGYGYWSYGNTFQVLLFNALETGFKQKLNLSIPDYYFQTGHYIKQMIGPSGKSFNYSDSGDDAKLNPSLFWFARQLGDQNIVWSELYFLKDIGKIPARDLVLFMIWANPDQLKKVSPPSEKIWIGSGKNPVAVLRSDWSKNGVYIGLKGGSPKINHGHMDVGSFVLEGLGERWTVDLGAEDYSKLEAQNLKIWSYSQKSDRWKVFRNGIHSHNTIIINNQDQNVDGYGKFYESDGSNHQNFVLMDLGTVYGPSVKNITRGVLLNPNDQSVLIQDKIETGNEKLTLKWQFLTDAQVIKTGDQFVELKKNGKKIRIALFGMDKSVTWNITSAKPMNEFENPNDGVSKVFFEVSLNPHQSYELNVMFIMKINSFNSKAVIKSMEDWGMN